MFRLCCVVSAFLLDHKLHGYYLHGKSVHQHADCSLEEMNVQVASEQKNWARHRGLEGGKESFELYLSNSFRRHFDREFLMPLAVYLVRQQQRARQAVSGRARDQQADMQPSDLSK